MITGSQMYTNAISVRAALTYLTFTIMNIIMSVFIVYRDPYWLPQSGC